MKPRQIANLVALGRIGFGVLLVAQPERLVVPWIGREGAHPGARVLGRSLGIRDLAIGAGALTAADGALAPWLVAALAADATDLAATLAAGSRLPLRGRILVGVAAFGGVALGAASLAGVLSGEE